MSIEQTCSASGPSRYVTTAIPYVNAAPHIGFAMEVVQADTLARLYRQQGYTVRLQAGADENSIKNVQAADAAGIPVAVLVEQNAAHFTALRTSLDLPRPLPISSVQSRLPDWIDSSLCSSAEIIQPRARHAPTWVMSDLHLEAVPFPGPLPLLRSHMSEGLYIPSFHRLIRYASIPKLR